MSTLKIIAVHPSSFHYSFISLKSVIFFKNEQINSFDFAFGSIAAVNTTVVLFVNGIQIQLLINN